MNMLWRDFTYRKLNSSNFDVNIPFSFEIKYLGQTRDGISVNFNGKDIEITGNSYLKEVMESEPQGDYTIHLKRISRKGFKNGLLCINKVVRKKTLPNINLGSLRKKLILSSIDYIYPKVGKNMFFTLVPCDNGEIFYTYNVHWVNNKPHYCGGDCDYCLDYEKKEVTACFIAMNGRLCILDINAFILDKLLESVSSSYIDMETLFCEGYEVNLRSMSDINSDKGRVLHSCNFDEERPLNEKNKSIFESCPSFELLKKKVIGRHTNGK